MKKNKLGVSLAELLAVVVIMGIIAAIAVPLVGQLIEDQKRDALKADAYAIADAARLYCMTNTDNVGCKQGQVINLLHINGAIGNDMFGGAHSVWYKTTNDTITKSGVDYEGAYNIANSEEVATYISKEYSKDDYYYVIAYGSDQNDDPHVRIYSKELDMEYAGRPISGNFGTIECNGRSNFTEGGYYYGCYAFN